LKDAGYDKLVEKIREIKVADREMVCRKINGLHKAYGWELKKITDSTKSGTFRHVFVMTFARRLKFVQTYHVVYRHSLLLYNKLLHKFV
jgi:hypothetical protein